MEIPNKLTQNQDHQKPVGPIIGSAIVVIILLIGALYIWGQQLNKQEKQRQESQKSEAEQEAELKKLKTESASDLKSIQAEIDALGAETIVPPLK
ncbi:hypothetical protein EPO17_00530 [Patescibacteria group bacterium]|nr:MAG: hypothetical protein EPO17_00530 [Patescibacteria group bacterium]